MKNINKKTIPEYKYIFNKDNILFFILPLKEIMVPMSKGNIIKI